MKDNFSVQAKSYSKYRPDYSYEIMEYILSFLQDKTCALDVATGNGQIANKLAEYFEQVYATDMSAEQLKNAVRKENIIYKQETAEHTSFSDNQFDLVTVAQAIHWFDFDAFYKEVYRVLKPNGIMAVMGYGLIHTNTETGKIINRFYNNIIGEYWDAERSYIEENYKTISFPFDEIYSNRKFSNIFTRTFEQLIGYLETWSATQHYIKKNNSNPVDLIRTELKESWEKSDKRATFPLLLRIGRLEKNKL